MSSWFWLLFPVLRNFGVEEVFPYTIIDDPYTLVGGAVVRGRWSQEVVRDPTNASLAADLPPSGSGHVQNMDDFSFTEVGFPGVSGTEG